MRPGVHPQSAANRARHAAVKFKTCNARLRRRLGENGVRRRRAYGDGTILPRFDARESLAAETDDEAGHAAVAYDEIGAEADRRDRDFARQMREKVRKIIIV